MLVGIIGCFLAVLFIGIDGRFVTPWQFLIICQARAWTMSTGFTLAFGAMFSKVWRVHRLSTKAKADQGKVSRAFKSRTIEPPLDKASANDLYGVIYIREKTRAERLGMRNVREISSLSRCLFLNFLVKIFVAAFPLGFFISNETDF